MPADVFAHARPRSPKSPRLLLSTLIGILFQSVRFQELNLKHLIKTLLNKVKVGDKVVFTAAQINGAYTVMSIDLPPAVQAR